MGITNPADIEQSFLIRSFIHNNTDTNMAPLLKPEK